MFIKPIKAILLIELCSSEIIRLKRLMCYNIKRGFKEKKILIGWSFFVRFNDIKIICVWL